MRLVLLLGGGHLIERSRSAFLQEMMERPARTEPGYTEARAWLESIWSALGQKIDDTIQADFLANPRPTHPEGKRETETPTPRQESGE